MKALRQTLSVLLMFLGLVWQATGDAATSVGWVLGAHAEPSRVSSLFPGQAAQVLEGDGFSPTPLGFASRVPSELSPVEAVEASLSSRGGLRITLPNDGNGSATFSLPGGFAIEVRERGLIGRGCSVKDAVAYSRRAGESYWTAGSEGYEEWVLAENAGAGPIAEWEVRGALLRQEGEAVEVVDGVGLARLRITAPQ